VIIQAAPRVHYRWLIDRTDCAATEGFRAIEAIDERGEIRGMVGFDLWTENAVQLHIACDCKEATRAVIRPTFDYAFSQCGKSICLAGVPSHRAHACDFARRVGFKEVFRVRDGWAKGDDMVLFEMRREDCPHIEVKHE